METTAANDNETKLVREAVVKIAESRKSGTPIQFAKAIENFINSVSELVKAGGTPNLRFMNGILDDVERALQSGRTKA